MISYADLTQPLLFLCGRNQEPYLHQGVSLSESEILPLMFNILLSMQDKYVIQQQFDVVMICAI